ncbi:hypothetical protein Y032_0378g310 [Ancylostoma ceylanicum]|uniref:Uncharacterized protein n=1 Tax=Ancylostoma ceylanicum TaxID=53326 RepID=A0A016RTC9_9BILA|nr:hypothetical protein Y032_0378g310 [Ancylostoma ceylanicum]
MDASSSQRSDIVEEKRVTTYCNSMISLSNLEHKQNKPYFNETYFTDIKVGSQLIFVDFVDRKNQQLINYY